MLLFVANTNQCGYLLKVIGKHDVFIIMFCFQFEDCNVVLQLPYFDFFTKNPIFEVTDSQKELSSTCQALR